MVYFSTPKRSARFFELVFITTGEDRIRHQHQVVRDFDAALLDDRHDRAIEVLVGAHAASDAVHDDANAASFHVCSSLARPLLYVSGVIVILAGLKAAAGIVVPLLLASFIGIVTTPLFLQLQRRMPAWMALAAMITGVVMIGRVLWGIVQTTAINSVNANRDLYATRLDEQLNALYSTAEGWGLTTVREDIGRMLSAQEIMTMMTSSFDTITGVLSRGFIVMLVVVFIWFEAAILPAKLMRAFPGHHGEKWQSTVANVRHYVVIKTWMSLLTGALVAIMLLVMGIDFALPLGILAFVLNYIPTIGSLIAGVPGCILALIVGGPVSMIIAIIGYTVINVGVSNGLEPRVMGQQLGLSPLVVILSMFFWGWVLGPVGMLLSVPLTMVARVAMASDDDTRALAILLGGAPRPKPKREQSNAIHDCLSVNWVLAVRYDELRLFTLTDCSLTEHAAPREGLGIWTAADGTCGARAGRHIKPSAALRPPLCSQPRSCSRCRSL